MNARDGEGIEEVFRVIARKLVEQRNRREEREALLVAAAAGARTPGRGGLDGGGDYFGARGGGGNVDGGNGSFRVGVGDKRKSWLGLPNGLSGGEGGEQIYEPLESARRKGRCC